MELDVELIVSTLDRHEVRYVLIGGLAAITHGSPFPTEDADVTPESSVENLTRLSAALSDLNARIRTDAVDGGLPFSHDGESLSRAQVWNLLTDGGILDISFTPNGTTGFDDLIRDAHPTQLGGVTVLVASLADVIRSKQAANRLKDQRVLPTLREINARRHER